MTQRYHNPFASSELVYPVGQKDVYQQFCQTSRELDDSLQSARYVQRRQQPIPTHGRPMVRGPLGRRPEETRSY